jgi:hypothetical protein
MSGIGRISPEARGRQPQLDNHHHIRSDVAARADFREVLRENIREAYSPRGAAKLSTDWGAQAVTAFQSACTGWGMDTSDCEFQFNDEIVLSPAGGYRNPNIQVTLPDGRVLKFAADLTLRNPRLAAYELRAMMKERDTQSA